VPVATDEKHTEPAAEGSAQVANADDVDESETHRKLLADGIYTPDELRRIYGLTDTELAALSKPKALSRQSVERELAEIRKEMRDNRQAYFKDEKKQARYRELLAQGKLTRDEQGRFRSGEEDAAPRAKAPSIDAESVDQEIAAIAKTMREDRRTYDKDTKMQARYRELLELRETLKTGPAPAEREESEPDDQGDAPGIDPALLEEWERAGGVEHHLKTAQRTATVALDALEEEDRASLEESYDALPPAAQTEIMRFLAVKGGAFPAASDAALQQFAESEEVGGELVKDWGRGAGRKLGVVRGRLGLMLKSMPPEDRTKAEAWFDALPAQQAKAVMKALAG
jgi:hypothetical protein